MKLESREDFVDLMYQILDPLKPLYTPGNAGIHIGVTAAHYDRQAANMEAFSRPLWALVPFWAGMSAGEETDGDVSWQQRYRQGLIHGTDPNHPEYWGKCSPFNQRFVEMAAIAYGMMYAPQVLWEPLTEKEKANLVAYLGQINEYPLPVCNWLLFAVLVNLALKKTGQAYDPQLLETYLEEMETFYLGNGWYCDGDSGQRDYYVSFAIHFYNLIYAHQEDNARGEKYRQRAKKFAGQFLYWFDEGGAAIPYGRSLTYRFSQVAFFSACVLTGNEVLPYPVMKGLIARHLSEWMEHPIFDRDGVLTIGYGYPNLIMAERYNAPGSPYWAMKTFALLALPKEHPFWTMEATPFPEISPACPQYEDEKFFYHYKSHTTAFPFGKYSAFGHGQLPAKYSKFAYDSRFGICMAKSCYELHENAPDSMLAFKINDYIYVRRICMEGGVTETGVWSKWSPYPGITVETVITPNASGHTRSHKITSDMECVAYDCGFAINKESAQYSAFASEHQAEVKNHNFSCVVSSGDCERAMVLDADPNTHLLYPQVAIPCVQYKILPGEQTLHTVVEAEYEKNS